MRDYGSLYRIPDLSVFEPSRAGQPLSARALQPRQENTGEVQYCTTLTISAADAMLTMNLWSTYHTLLVIVLTILATLKLQRSLLASRTTHSRLEGSKRLRSMERRLFILLVAAGACQQAIAKHRYRQKNGVKRRPPPTMASSHYPPKGQIMSDERRALQPETVTDYAFNQTYNAAIRSSLLENYDKNSYPWELAWQAGNDTFRTGVPIEFGLNFHKVLDVDVAESTADLVVWTRISWTDPRLAWDPMEFGNTTKTWFWIEDGMGGNEVSVSFDYLS